jgi:putative membrane protein
MMDMGMMGIGMIFSMILWVLLLGAVIYGVYSLISKGIEKKEDSAIKILKERFARGEIDEEEYEKRSVTLRKKL